MSSLPLEVHEVLEQEYVSMHGDLAVPEPEYTADDIIDEPWALTILDACGMTTGKACPDDVQQLVKLRTGIEKPPDAADPKKALYDEAVIAATRVLGIASAMNAVVMSTSANVIKKLTDSPAVTESGRAIIDDYENYTEGVSSFRRREINRFIVDDAFLGAVKRYRDIRLSALYTNLHARSDEDARTALCISGGGIRTATFALGIIQGLAGARILLDKFHLSTVSGGGYIGSWLSSWVRRHPQGIEGVQEDLVRADTAVEGVKDYVPNAAPGNEPQPVRKGDFPKKKIDPEPRPLRHLRAYSNYLSPKLGFLSGDTWTMASLYVRNLLLNLLVLVPLLALALAVPRLFAWLLHKDVDTATTHAVFTTAWLLRITVAALAIGFGYLGMSRPTVHGRRAGAMDARGSAGFLLLHVLPLIVASTALSLYWARVFGEQFISLTLRRDWPYYAAAGVAMSFLPAGIYYYRFFVQSSAAERREPMQRQHGKMKKFGSELLATVIGLATLCGLLYLLANKVFDQPVRDVVDLTSLPPFLRGLIDATPISALYVCLAVPLVLLCFFVQNAAFVGISSKVNEDYDREWWGRGGALVMMTAVLLGLASFIAVFGPVLLYRAPVIVASLGGISGILAGFLGYSAQTPASDKQKQEKKTSSAVTSAALGMAVPLFVVFFLAAISLGTTVLIRLIRDEKVPVTLKWKEQFQSTATFTQTTPIGTGAKLEAKYETEKTPFLSMATVNGVEHLKTLQDTHWPDLLGILGAAIGAVLLSGCISVNRFSMHGLYRNRLIRAYLGASRYTRDPDGFTGFDPHDNLQMYELRPDLLWPTSFTDFKGFVQQLKDNCTKSDSVEQTIWNALDKKTRQWLEDPNVDVNAAKNALMQNINNILLNDDLGRCGADATTAARLRCNRTTLQTTFATSLRPPQKAPLHVINTALNLTAGEKLAWQQRQAESFTVSPLHSGSFYVGYRDSREYGGKDGISVGTAVTISGAAASPNQGYHSSPAMAFLLTILNVRLGSWLGNPGLAGRKTYDSANPRTNLEPLMWELTGTTNDQCPLVYLSDGGHFENLGIYEMVLRRCRFIVVSDGGCDPKCSFEDLGNAIRKIRTDLGVPIDIEYDDMHPRGGDSTLRKGRYVTTARIRYSAIDAAPMETVDGVQRPKDIDGTLVYIKPGLYDDTYFPKDVYNYATESPDFPHETTADQFFSESQFESYRALGRHAFNEVCNNYPPPDPPGAPASLRSKNTFATTYRSVHAFTQAVMKNTPKMAVIPPDRVIADRLDTLAEKVTIAIKKAGTDSAVTAQETANKVTDATNVLAETVRLAIKDAAGK